MKYFWQNCFLKVLFFFKIFQNTSAKKKRDELATEGTITTSFRRVPIDNSIPGKDPSQITQSFGGICTSQSQSGYHWNSSREAASPDSHDERELGDNDVSVLNSGGGDSVSELGYSCACFYIICLLGFVLLFLFWLSTLV